MVEIDDLNHWNGCITMSENNCYNYALGCMANNFLQPGSLTGEYKYRDDHFHMFPDKFKEAALADGLLEVPPDGYLEGWHKVCYLFSDKDYHWYRQDPDGTWSHKRGSCAATDRAYHSDEPITDPVADGVLLGYHIFGGYLIAPDDPNPGLFDI